MYGKIGSILTTTNPSLVTAIGYLMGKKVVNFLLFLYKKNFILNLTQLEKGE